MKIWFVRNVPTRLYCVDPWLDIHCVEHGPKRALYTKPWMAGFRTYSLIDPSRSRNDKVAAVIDLE